MDIIIHSFFHPFDHPYIHLSYIINNSAIKCGKALTCNTIMDLEQQDSVAVCCFAYQVLYQPEAKTVTSQPIVNTKLKWKTNESSAYCIFVMKIFEYQYETLLIYHTHYRWNSSGDGTLRHSVVAQERTSREWFSRLGVMQKGTQMFLVGV